MQEKTAVTADGTTKNTKGNREAIAKTAPARKNAKGTGETVRKSPLNPPQAHRPKRRNDHDHPPRSKAAIGALLSLTGCNEHVIYHSYRHVPGSGWSRRDTLTFDIDTVRAEATYQFELGLRSTDSYPYTVIWLAVEREFSHPDTLRRDTVKCQLMDPVTHRMGKGIYMYQYDVPVPPMALRRGQTGQVRIIHLMQREVLPGIHDVGVLISR